MNKEEEEYLLESIEELLETYSLEELLSHSDWEIPELIAVLVDLQYLKLPEVKPVR